MNDDEIPGDCGEATTKRGTLAGIFLVKQRECQLLLQRIENLARAIGRPVVDDDELDAERNRTERLRIVLIEQRDLIQRQKQIKQSPRQP